jgi:RHS repeat-associated protein
MSWLVRFQGGRTTAQGYPDIVGNNVRQKFTSKERDNETGLDYFGARYFASLQGRFTSPDPLMASAHVVNPQTWNRYTYALNNPLSYVDPDGMKPVFKDYKDLTEDERRILENSKITFGKGDKAKTLSGEALYNHRVRDCPA